MIPGEVPALSLLAIVVMAIVTASLRVGGFWLMGRVPLTARVRRVLEAMPGVVVAATIPPIVIDIGFAAILAVAAAIGVMVLLRSAFLAMVLGVATVAAIRGLGF